ncbi:MAG: sigma-70 family RNA polymerase sigma factor [Gammaproteobacteria bacterium]|nr:sigma-70 family RNA polymerase sigma factor [Gammaproteobacteria bacterium]
MNNFHFKEKPDAVIILALKTNNPQQETTTINSVYQQAENLLESIAKHQDKTAFEQLYWIFAPKIKSYMKQHGADDSLSEELAQESLMQVWLKADKYKPELSQPSTWIFRIARNIYIDKLRKQKCFDADEISNFENELSENQNYDHEIDSQRFKKLIKTKLSSEQYQILELSYFKGLNQPEISAQLAIPLGTVKSRLRLAFEKIKSAMGGQHEY